jgi:hypothetical protein
VPARSKPPSQTDHFYLQTEELPACSDFATFADRFYRTAKLTLIQMRDQCHIPVTVPTSLDIAEFRRYCISVLGLQFDASCEQVVLFSVKSGVVVTVESVDRIKSIDSDLAVAIFPAT